MLNQITHIHFVTPWHAHSTLPPIPLPPSPLPPSPLPPSQGDPTRHMVAIFHGCVPVFTLGTAGSDDALPFDELLPWERFSLRVPKDAMRTLPNVVRAAARDHAALSSMQAELGCAWRALFWTSLKGSCFGESVRGDAFDTLVQVLKKRQSSGGTGAATEEARRGDVVRPGTSGGTSIAGSACEAVGALPKHLATADALARLAPGTTWRATGL